MAHRLLLSLGKLTVGMMCYDKFSPNSIAKGWVMKKIFLKSRGQVEYAGMAAVLIGALALGADVSVLYVNWEQLQRAADAAALAGANYLPLDPATAQTTATTYAENNGIQSGEISGAEVSSDDLSITVNLTRTVPYSFAMALGMTNGSVSVKATAGVQQNGAYGRGLMPIGLSCPGGSDTGNCTGDYTVGTTYALKQDQSDTSLSGNWGALALGGNGTSVYRNNIELGYSGPIAVGTSVATEPGNVVGPTAQAIGDRITEGATVDPSIAAGSAPPSGAALSSYEYDPRLVVLPMVDYKVSGKGGKTAVPVVQFAQMWLLGTSGNNATVNAVYLGLAPTTGNTTVADFGMLTPVLLN
jgi:Flp pilus assembly protein TadG